MFDTLYSQIGGVIMLTVCVFALWQGDQPERVGAGAYLLAWLLSLALQVESVLTTLQLALLLIDLVVLGVFVGLGWKSRKTWPIWAAGFQLIGLMSYFVTLVDQRLPAWSSITVVNIAAYGVLIAIAVGTFWAWQERRALDLK